VQHKGKQHLYVNNHAGDFNQVASPAVNFEWMDAKLADVNGDGRDDLVLIARATNTLQIWLNTGSGTYFTAPALKVALPAPGISLAVADFNGDGQVDIYVVLADAQCRRTSRDAAPDVVFWGQGGARWTMEQLTQNFIGCGHLASVVNGRDVLLENGNVDLMGPSYILHWAK
jgi:hypothetical protein